VSISALMSNTGAAGWLSTLKSTSALSLLAMGLVASWAIIAIFGPLVAPYDPLAQGSAFLAGPSSGHLFGTDELGRDVLSRVIWGARVSIPYSVLMVASSVGVGAVSGGVAGYFGGWVDEVIMRVADFVFAFPTIILAMAITAALGPDLKNAVIAVVVVSWPTYARVVRSLVLSAMHSDYVLVARLLGHSSVRTMAVDVLPNVAGPMLVFATLGLGNAMLFLAGLSFLGLGSQPPAAEWGSMISEATQYYNGWWLALFPGLAIVSVVLALNVLGDRLRNIWDPRQISR
jgi:peptide/nickel transport system permease protein